MFRRLEPLHLRRSGDQRVAFTLSEPSSEHPPKPSLASLGWSICSRTHNSLGWRCIIVVDLRALLHYDCPAHVDRHLGIVFGVAALSHASFLSYHSYLSIYLSNGSSHPIPLRWNWTHGLTNSIIHCQVNFLLHARGKSLEGSYLFEWSHPIQGEGLRLGSRGGLGIGPNCCTLVCSCVAV